MLEHARQLEVLGVPGDTSRRPPDLLGSRLGLGLWVEITIRGRVGLG